jgi:hypothetical protein
MKMKITENRREKLDAIANYSNVPLILAVILFVISAYSVDIDAVRSNDAVTYGYYLLATGAVLKFIRYVGGRQESTP